MKPSFLPFLPFLLFPILSQSQPTNTVSHSALNQPRDAFYAAEDACAKALKSPSTAKFSSPYSEDSGCRLYGYQEWEAYGYVDAQNSFGAMIREHWQAIVKLSDDRYVIRYLRLGDSSTGYKPAPAPVPIPASKINGQPSAAEVERIAARNATAARKSAAAAATLKFHLNRAQSGDLTSQLRLIQLYEARGDTNAATLWRSRSATNSPAH